MKILFLDVDGVLNSGESFHINHQARLAAEARGEIKIGSVGAIKEFGWPLGHLYTPYLERLNRILEETDAQIVVSSVWRSNELEELQSWFTTKGFKYKERIIDRTANFQLSYGRGYEIQEWLNNSDDVERFAILDDDSDMLHLMPYLVHTDQRVGLQDENVNEAIALLNGQIEEVANHQRRSEITAHYYGEIWNHGA